MYFEVVYHSRICKGEEIGLYCYLVRSTLSMHDVWLAVHIYEKKKKDLQQNSSSFTNPWYHWG